MSEKTPTSGDRAGNQQPASGSSNRAAIVAFTSGIAFALIGGTSYLASIRTRDGKPLGLVVDAWFALFTFGPFCIVAAAVVTAIVTKQWSLISWRGCPRTRALGCVALPLLLASVALMWAFLQSFMHMALDSGL